MGGLLAFEMAQQLLSAGDTVSTLAMVDTQVPGREAVRDLFDMLWLATARWPGNKPRRTLRLVRSIARPSTLRWLRSLGRSARTTVRAYQPCPYPGRVVFFEAQDHGGRPQSQGWRPWISGEFTVIPVPGDHQSIFRDPGINALSEAVRRVLRD